jgi:hypothetical protein
LRQFDIDAHRAASFTPLRRFSSPLRQVFIAAAALRRWFSSFSSSALIRRRVLAALIRRCCPPFSPIRDADREPARLTTPHHACFHGRLFAATLTRYAIRPPYAAKR